MQYKKIFSNNDNRSLAALKHLCQRKGIAVAERILEQFLYNPQNSWRHHHISIQQQQMKLDHIHPLHLPVVLMLKNKSACVLTAINADHTAQIIAPEIEQDSIRVSMADLNREFDGRVITIEEHKTIQYTPLTTSRLIKLFRRPLVLLASCSAMMSLLCLVIPGFTYVAIQEFISSTAHSSLRGPGLITAIALSVIGCLQIYRTRLITATSKQIAMLFKQQISYVVTSTNLSSYKANAKKIADLHQCLKDSSYWLPIVFIKTISITFGLGALALAVFLLKWLSMIPIAALLATLFLSKIINTRQLQLNNESSKKTLPEVETYKTIGAEHLLMKELEQMDLQQISNRSWYQFFLKAIFAVMLLSLLVIGGEFVRYDEILVANLVTGTVLCCMALLPFQRFSSLLKHYQYFKNCLQILDEYQHEWLDVVQPISRETFRGKIHLAEVSFSYATQTTPLLENISLTINPGERVGIIGGIGSGKSTLLKLMAGLLQPQSGKVFLDEIPIGMFEAQTLSSSLSYIPQKAILLDGSLRDNLIAKKPWLDDEQLIDCLRLLGIDELFLKRAGGLDFQVNTAAEQLSLGEQQLIGLARGIITYPSVLLLDEPTGALDSNSERHFVRLIEDYNPAATLVVVTHKMALLQLLDRLIVLQDGKILADGPREQVLSVIRKIKSVTKVQQAM